MSSKPDTISGLILQSSLDIAEALTKPRLPLKEDEPASRGMVSIDRVMTNFDHEIDSDAEERLKANPNCYGEYTAWNFWAAVWYENGKFHCYLKQYQVHQKTLVADSLQEIMNMACEEFGAD